MRESLADSANGQKSDEAQRRLVVKGKKAGLHRIRESLAQFQPKDLELITSVAGQAAMFIENTILAKKIEAEIVLRDRFSRLVAPNVADLMMSGKLEVKKGGQLVQELTIFNSDIRGFTAMSEGTAAEVIVEMLNDYFELMVEILFKYEGTLDKFMGDGIMAFWGAPLAHRDDAIRHRRHGEHERPPVLHRAGRPGRDQRGDAGASGAALRLRRDRRPLAQGQGEAHAAVQRDPREAERGREGGLVEGPRGAGLSLRVPRRGPAVA